MALFGYTSSLSRYQKPLKTKEIKKIVSRVSISTLDRKEEELVENEIDKARGSDGKISLRQIEEVLRSLFSKKQISRSDKKKLMEHFEDYFNKKFGDST